MNSNLEQYRINDEQFHLIFEDVREMASSATYVFSKMTINIVELEDTINQQKMKFEILLEPHEQYQITLQI